MEHSKEVGGSTAERVMNCPGSVALCKRMPPKPSSKYADEGTLLHSAMDRILSTDIQQRDVIGMAYKDIVLTEELYEAKIVPAIAALNEIDPDCQMEYACETRVGFGDYIPGAFGTTDLLGRLGKKAIVLDWKFGDGVPVPAENSAQHFYYAAAAMRTPEAQWVFDGVTEVEFIIVQPPNVRRWTTSVTAIKAFEKQLAAAVKLSKREDAPIEMGKWCKWCAAKPICPEMTGAKDRALMTALHELNPNQINAWMHQADMLETWIADLRELAYTMATNGIKLADYKVVQKKTTRRWVDEAKAADALKTLGIEPYTADLVSPAVAEKMLKKLKKELPEELVSKTSSGTTLAPADDIRPEVLQLGTTLANAMAKIQ